MEAEKAVRTNCDVPALWLEHKAELRNYILKRVKDREVTNDILQEVLLKVYKFCISSSGIKNLRSWLFQIARNSIIDHFRRQAKFSGPEMPEIIEEDESAALKDAQDIITPMLGLLPELYAEPLRMADIEGIKQADIATRLGLSLTATKSRIQRARQLLKEEFITCCHFETDATGNLLSLSIKDSCKSLQEFKKEKFQ